jgi:pimeloyl-ACP methyl ester carboxylesterase
VLAERDAAFNGADDRAADAARHTLGNMPIIILTSTLHPGPPAMAADMDKVGLAVYALHSQMTGLSTRARHRVVPGASHYIQYDKPQAVLDAVAEVLADVRAGPRAPGH